MVTALQVTAAPISHTSCTCCQQQLKQANWSQQWQPVFESMSAQINDGNNSADG